MDNPWKVISAFVGVFIAGAVFGGFFTARTASRKIQEVQPPPAAVAVTPAPPQSTPAVNRPNANNRGGVSVTPVMLQRLAVQLKLTDEQKEKITPIIKRADDDMRYLRTENFRSTSRVLERMHADISVLLTPEQKQELEVQKRIMQDRMKEAEKERRSEQLLRNQQKLNPGNRGNPDTSALKGN
jgi:Spy/CpxP family protein refolding chaperone